MFDLQPRWILCGDAQIACYDVGQGQPLVLLHGNGESSAYWKAQIPEFTRFYRVLAVDSRGHGASERGAVELTFAQMAEDLKTVLDACGVRKAHILGFSDGGDLAIKFALTYPNYVDKLILNGANVEMFAGIKPHVQLPVYVGYALLHGLGRISRRAARKRDVLGLMVHPYGVRMDDLSQLTMPTLILVGEHDMVRDSQTREMAAHIPHCRVEVFRDGDHFIAAKQPSRFNRTVIEFLLGR
ncbi:MAG: alpha/beta hydrolase [Eubacteriales bacterium]|nr:alpha/beta hydrolase [Eubacteriales bacterium]